MSRFDWETAEYPCLGIEGAGQIVCFIALCEGCLLERGATDGI